MRILRRRIPQSVRSGSPGRRRGSRRHSGVRIGLLALTLPLACGGGDAHDHDGGDGHADDSVQASDGAAQDGAPLDKVKESVPCTPSGMTEADLTRKTDAASVTVTAALLNGLEHCGKPRLSFTLVLDTHSVDLTGIDLPASARVDTSDGQAVAAGFAWAGGDESSHHRDGTLSVAAPSLAAADWLRLTVKNVAGVDRTFEWGKTVLAHDLP